MSHRIVGSNFDTMSRETTSHPAASKALPIDFVPQNLCRTTQIACISTSMEVVTAGAQDELMQSLDYKLKTSNTSYVTARHDVQYFPAR